MIRLLWGVVVFLYCSFVFALERLESSKHYLGTTVSAVVCTDAAGRPEAQDAMDRVWSKFAQAQARMNVFDPASDVSRLNHAFGHEIVVDDVVYALIEVSKRYKVITGGVFDVSIGPLADLWKAAASRNEMPSMDDIRQRKRLVDAGRIELLGQGRVKLPDGMKIDLGGDAAGFLVDEGVKIFRQAGFNDFLIDAGGEIYAGGVSCQGRPWRVGINDPRNYGRVNGVVELFNAAVSTSGSYEKYVTINGDRWPHIINPITGYPPRGVVSATVIAPTAFDADVLSTALYVLGPREGFRLIDRLGLGYAAMMLAPGVDGRLREHMSRDYLKLKFGK